MELKTNKDETDIQTLSICSKFNAQTLHDDCHDIIVIFIDTILVMNML